MRAPVKVECVAGASSSFTWEGVSWAGVHRRCSVCLKHSIPGDPRALQLTRAVFAMESSPVWNSSGIFL